MTGTPTMKPNKGINTFFWQYLVDIIIYIPFNSHMLTIMWSISLFDYWVSATKRNLTITSSATDSWKHWISFIFTFQSYLESSIFNLYLHLKFIHPCNISEAILKNSWKPVRVIKAGYTTSQGCVSSWFFHCG